MRDLFPVLLAAPIFASTNLHQADSWWQTAQKNGVGFVFFLLFLVVAYMSYKRERNAEEKRERRETENNTERVKLQTQIRDLNIAQLNQHTAHAARLEQLVREQTKSMNDNAAELRNLTRNVKRPCLFPDPNEDE